MSLFQRITICFIAGCMVACGKRDADLVAPIAEPEAVVIGCAIGGADIEVRTQIDDDLSVRWLSGDEIRLWAREHGAADFLTDVRNVPFRFDYYSPQWSRAGFTGTIVGGVSASFSSEKSYDYYAVSPAPVADSDVAGTLVTLDVPTVQSGAFDGSYDIMTAHQENAVALKKGDNNPSINLKFRHHVHVMKFSVPQNALGEKIRSVELTFPQPVTGRMTVDMSGVSADDLSGIDSDKVSVEFPKGEERDAGDTFFVTIAPAVFEAGSSIGMRIIGTTGETSVDYTFAAPKLCEAEHLTPVVLHVPAKNTFYTVVEFKVVDNDRAEHSGKPNLFGVNTLGERVHTVCLKGEPGAFANAVRMPEGCSASADGSTLTCVVPGNTAFDGVFELMFVSRKDADSKCPWSKWDSSALSGKTLEVEYESESALIKSQEGWKPVQAVAPTIQDGRINTLSALSVPYLFEEDFSGLTGSFHYDDNADVGGTSHSGSNSAISLDNYDNSGMPVGWYGARCGGENGAVRICSRLECIVNVKGTYHGRIDAPNFVHIKLESQVKIKASFDYSIARNVYNSNYDRQPYLAVGVTNDENRDASGKANAGNDLLSPSISNVVKQDLDASSDRGGSFTNVSHSVELTPDNYYTKDHRLVWEVYTHEHEGGSLFKYNTSNNYVYLDNIKVSIAH